MEWLFYSVDIVLPDMDKTNLIALAVLNKGRKKVINCSKSVLYPNQTMINKGSTGAFA